MAFGSISQWRQQQQQQTETIAPSALRGSPENPFRGPGGKAGDWFWGKKPGQYGYSSPGSGGMKPLPQNIDEIRQQVEQFRSHPAFPFTAPGAGPDPYKGHREFMGTWEGVQNRPEPADFNAGPRMAASAWNEPAEWMNPSASMMGWKPAQEEEFA